MKSVEFYCYYKIDLEKLKLYREMAAEISEFFLKHPGCHSYQFLIGVDPERKSTVMERGSFDSVEDYQKIKREIENEFSALFKIFDKIIEGGLTARMFEFFTRL